jgi:hypothetical protein
VRSIEYQSAARNELRLERQSSRGEALLQFLDLLERDLDTLSSGRVRLSDVQRDLLQQIRMRQADLDVE